MTVITRNFTFLTAAFPHGAYQSQGFNRPDLRGPSVKGHLRWWYDALFGGADASGKSDEDKLFGGLKNPKPGDKPGPEASRTVVRVRTLSTKGDFLSTHILPHKPDPRDRGPKSAIAPGTGYELSLISRREDWTEQERQRLEQVLDSWLLLGAVGQRANRAAGSLWPEGSPTSVTAYESRAAELLGKSKLVCAVLPGSYAHDECKVRFVAGDFIEGPTTSVQRGPRQVEAVESWWPFGSADPRKPSSLKLRAALLENELRLVALWDGRYHSNDNLRRGIEQLATAKEIGRLLKQAATKLCP
jgi:hypothetical protein